MGCKPFLAYLTIYEVTKGVSFLVNYCHRSQTSATTIHQNDTIYITVKHQTNTIVYVITEVRGRLCEALRTSKVSMLHVIETLIIKAESHHIQHYYFFFFVLVLHRMVPIKVLQIINHPSQLHPLKLGLKYIPVHQQTVLLTISLEKWIFTLQCNILL